MAYRLYGHASKFRRARVNPHQPPEVGAAYGSRKLPKRETRNRAEGRRRRTRQLLGRVVAAARSCCWTGRDAGRVQARRGDDARRDSAALTSDVVSLLSLQTHNRRAPIRVDASVVGAVLRVARASRELGGAELVGTLLGARIVTRVGCRVALRVGLVCCLRSLNLGLFSGIFSVRERERISKFCRVSLRGMPS